MSFHFQVAVFHFQIQIFHVQSRTFHSTSYSTRESPGVSNSKGCFSSPKLVLLLILSSNKKMVGYFYRFLYNLHGSWSGGGVCSCFGIAMLASKHEKALHRYASFVAKIRTMVLIFPAESADGLCTESEAVGARTEDPEEQRLKAPRPVATSLKQTSCLPPRKASAKMEINIFPSSVV